VGGVIYIAKDLTSALKRVVNRSWSFTVIDSGDREFLVEHAHRAITKAHITTASLERIVLISPKFSPIAQNKLLKILEEPPKNKEFILITSSKASLLPTVKSRLPIKVLDRRAVPNLKLSIDLDSLTIREIYELLKERQKISKSEAKEIVESISIHVMRSSRYRVDGSLLDYLSNSIRALDVGSNPTFILGGTLLKLLNHRV